jgi:hypothetical protein
MAPGSFKSDESFLRKLSIGAAGTRRALEDLRRHGHEPIELERGSTTFKIWPKTIKRKRLRMPDILCLRCGRRFESRGKTALKIAMSHSVSDASRAWNVGLDDRDFVALVGVTSGDSPTAAEADSLVQYIAVRELREAYDAGDITVTKPKGAEEGSEVQVHWAAAVMKTPGRVEEVTPTNIHFREDSGKRRKFNLPRRHGRALRALVRAGEELQRNQIVASVVTVNSVCLCPGGATLDLYLGYTKSASVVDRFMAVKALGHFAEASATAALVERVSDEKEDIYVRVESAAVLMRRERPEGHSYLQSLIDGGHASFRMEAAIVLGEVATAEAATLLRRMLRNQDEHTDVRAAAAWSLGEIGLNDDNVGALIDSFTNLEFEIRAEAARALAKLAAKYRDKVVAAFPTSTPDRRPGIAWALARAGVSVGDLLPSLIDDDTRQWVAYMIGSQQPSEVSPQIKELRTRDPEVFFAVTVLWKILDSWISEVDDY